MPEFSTTYLRNADNVFRTSADDASQDVITQLSKVATGLLTTKYAAHMEGGEIRSCSTLPTRRTTLPEDWL